MKCMLALWLFIKYFFLIINNYILILENMESAKKNKVGKETSYNSFNLLDY